MCGSYESGFIMYPNVLVMNLPKTKLNATQLGIINIVLRFTTGFNRTSHSFSVSFFEPYLDTSTVGIKKELKKLIEFNILIEVKAATRTTPREIMINEDVNSWSSAVWRKERKVIGEMTEEKPKKSEKGKKIAFAHNVFLTQIQYDTLVKKHGKELVDKKIADMSKWQESPKGKVYKQHSRALQMWLKNEPTPNTKGKTRLETKINELDRLVKEHEREASS